MKQQVLALLSQEKLGSDNDPLAREVQRISNYSQHVTSAGQELSGNKTGKKNARTKDQQRILSQRKHRRDMDQK
jgi:hypothetical protein